MVVSHLLTVVSITVPFYVPIYLDQSPAATTSASLWHSDSRVTLAQHFGGDAMFRAAGALLIVEVAIAALLGSRTGEGTSRTRVIWARTLSLVLLVAGLVATVFTHLVGLLLVAPAVFAVAAAFATRPLPDRLPLREAEQSKGQ
jgi:hypothetical protein